MTWQRYNKNLRKSALLAEYFSFWTKDRHIPHVIQSEGCKDGSSPPAQAYRRRNVRGNGVSPTEQQITAGQHGRSCHHWIKIIKSVSSRIWSYMVDELLNAKVQQFCELVALSPHLFIFFGLMIAGKRVGTRGLSGQSPIVIFCTFLPIRLVISIEKCNFAARIFI